MSGVDRDGWLAWRREGVGASEVAALIGMSPWATPYGVWLSKTQGLDIDESERMRWGSLIEPVILGEVETRTGLVMAGRQLQVVHREHAHHRATLDAYAAHDADASLDDGLHGVEVKVTGDRRWDRVPDHYWCQAQWQIHVTGLPMVVLAVLHAGVDLELYEIERDAEDIAVLVEAVDRFWREHVVTGIPPAVTGADLDHLRHAAGQAAADGELVADDTLVDLVAQLHAARAAVDEDEAMRDTLTARLLAALANHDTLLGPDGRTLATWRAGRRFDLDAARAAHPDIAAGCERPAIDVDEFRRALGRKGVDAFMRTGTTRTLRLTTTTSSTKE